MKSEGNAFSEQGVSSYSRPLLSGKNVTALDRWLATKLMEVVGNPPIRIVLWNDQAVLAPKEAIATMHFHDRGSLYKLITNPDLHFGDLYSSGRITVEGDLVAFLVKDYENPESLAKAIRKACEDMDYRQRLAEAATPQFHEWFAGQHSPSL